MTGKKLDRPKTFTSWLQDLCASVLILSTLLSGCAVLTIDVDVYKGPLMNQDDVQLEEAAVLAIATKPLLQMVATEITDVTSDDLLQKELSKQLQNILCLYGKTKPEGKDSDCKGMTHNGDVSLEEAYEQYINNSNSSKPLQSEDNKNLLLGRLTRFAERVRVLGNYSILAVGAQKEMREGSQKGASNANGEKRKLESLDYFVRVLQAIGNTILFQVDAIRTTHAWNKTIEDRLQQEVAALGKSEYGALLKPDDTEKLGIKTSREVLDQVVSTLQYRYLHEVETDGPKKEALGRALKEAYAYRANQVFLRSSAAYLRTSYPATTLQEQGNQTNIPLIREAMVKALSLGFAGGSAEKTKIRNELNNQYWQNINQIKLVGGGSTNYAVVKDDTGNWYVKGYSTNYEEILKNIQSLAVHSLTGLSPAATP